MKKLRETKGVNVSSTTGVILEGSPEDRMRERTLSFDYARNRKYSFSVSALVRLLSVALG